MKRILLLLLLLSTVTTANCHEYSDSVLLERIFCFQRNYAHDVNGFSTNVYLKHFYNIKRRNATLWMIPSMYPLAKGQRKFLSEQYNHFTFNDVDDYENLNQVFYTTIPRNKHTMSTLLCYLTPDLYNETIYRDHVLSPFNRYNKLFYKYTTTDMGNGKIRLYFRPKWVMNTQLVKGQAIVNYATGRLEQIELNGEFDMIRFHTISTQGDHGARALTPQLCVTDVAFNFVGNNITSHFEVAYDCPITLPDTVSIIGNRHLIDSVRPFSLSEEEEQVYQCFDSLRHAKRISDSIEAYKPMVIEKRSKSKDNTWDMLGENLFSKTKSSSENGYIWLSPLLDPQYISYSKSKGLSYKMRLGAHYEFSKQTCVDFNPKAGYNFKLKQFFFTAPIRLEYSHQRRGFLDLIVGNGNRLSNQNTLDEIAAVDGEDSQWLNEDLHIFRDLYVQLKNHYMIVPWLGIEGGITFHHRRSLHASQLRQIGIENDYKSLAPLLSVKIRPWRSAPIFSIDYERGLKFDRFNLPYERLEADASWKKRMHRLQVFNARIGGGLYTLKQVRSFMDFANFRDNNLPEGWDDDWSGNFQLLSSSVYNESKYYIRGNISYESPLMGLSFVPIAGHYIERERIYLSSLVTSHSRLYSELGYGFSSRYISMGVFAGFRNWEYQEIGCKFTIELFRRW
ncbi:DUF5686 family protein [Prevotella sp. E13-17]|uniref:DUF5686 family protein n=1 Tax=Prevotella sp. E13-17 TaxID=2913616 RepID=UPI001EDA49FA|nr:DUF5686 family protein [Prevotella sp. E13-17]UKK52241.1 DUF5686 family protein [Prevotella sp. E13-17]